MIKVDLDPKAELLDDFLFAELCLYIDMRISLALCVARELLLYLVVNIVGINFVRFVDLPPTRHNAFDNMFALVSVD
jgi:hypothetical protein